jgi:hypothetical protein
MKLKDQHLFTKTDVWDIRNETLSANNSRSQRGNPAVCELKGQPGDKEQSLKIWGRSTQHRTEK